MNSSFKISDYVCICTTYPPINILVEGVGDNYSLSQVKYLGNDKWITIESKSISIYYWRFLPAK